MAGGDGATPSSGERELRLPPLLESRVSDGPMLKFVATVKWEPRGLREGAREIAGEDGTDTETDGEGGESRVGEVRPFWELGESKAGEVGEVYCPRLPCPGFVGEGLRERSKPEGTASGWCWIWLAFPSKDEGEMDLPRGKEIVGYLLDGDAGDDLELEKNRRPLYFGILASREGPLLVWLVEDLEDSPDTWESLTLFSDENSCLRSVDLT